MLHKFLFLTPICHREERKSNSVCMFSNSCLDFCVRYGVNLITPNKSVQKQDSQFWDSSSAMKQSSGSGHLTNSKNWLASFLRSAMEKINDMTNVCVSLNRHINNRSFRLKCFFFVLNICLCVNRPWKSLRRSPYPVHLTSLFIISSAFPSSFYASQIDILTLMNAFSFFGVHWCD